MKVIFYNKIFTLIYYCVITIHWLIVFYKMLEQNINYPDVKNDLEMYYYTLMFFYIISLCVVGISLTKHFHNKIIVNINNTINTLTVLTLSIAYFEKQVLLFIVCFFLNILVFEVIKHFTVKYDNKKNI